MRTGDRTGEGDYYVIVPAVMGVGLLLSLATLVRDEVGRLRGHAARNRQVRALGHATAVAVLQGTDAARRDHTGLRGRTPTATTAAVALAFAVYLVPGATWNFFNPVNPMRDLGWLWAVSMSAVVVAAAVGLVLARAALRWSDLPAASRPVLLAQPLTAAPVGGTRRPRAARPPDGRPGRPSVSRRLARASAAALLAFVALSVLVAHGAPEVLDDPLRTALDKVDAVRRLRVLNPLAETETAVAVGAAIGLATWRCRPFAVTYLVALAAAWGLAVGTNRLVGRARPDGVLQDISSYPSGHVVVAAIMTGLLPVAVLVFTRRRRIALAVAAVLGTGLVGIAVDRVSVGAHWPTDVLGSLLLGTAVTAAALAVVLAPSSHRSCRSCPWAGDEPARGRAGGQPGRAGEGPP